MKPSLLKSEAAFLQLGPPPPRRQNIVFFFSSLHFSSFFGHSGLSGKLELQIGQPIKNKMCKNSFDFLQHPFLSVPNNGRFVEGLI
jgi:hypothetical protein